MQLGTHFGHLVCIYGILYWGHYICVVLRPVFLLLIHDVRSTTFQRDKAWPHVAVIFRSFLDAENNQLLSWPACSPDLSLIENFWSVVAEGLARHIRLSMICGILLKRLHMPFNISTKNTKAYNSYFCCRVECSKYWFLRVYDSKCFEILTNCYF